ncbi:glycerol kinase GlpK [Paremcibacter congregatus]|uniref:glycerol kinase GlpK n=1 Tax=Paremcibacter congregatus TaxID=2043170 RepID=UPI003A910204
MTGYILALDQGTTSSRAMIFDDTGAVVARAQQEIPLSYPRDGWVELAGADILSSTFDCARQALSQMPDGTRPQALGITNQRETTLIWDRATGEPVYPAIVWQDRRTAEQCREMVAAGQEAGVTEKTGLLLDPYFSATKISWILDHVPGARARAARGELAFGTVDSFLLWHLTGGEVHATDVTNAARTLLFNIHDLAWDEALLDLFRVPAEVLPEVQACDHHFGAVKAELFGFSLPITAMAGDQQAALVGQNCLTAGDVKCTYGTGGFLMMNVGSEPVMSQNRLLSTVAYQVKGQTAYALEGSFFSAGSSIQWLRDGLGVIAHAAETEDLARSIDSCKGVYLVPAFTGLGAPHWNPDARGSLFGLTRDSGRAEIARAALESIGYQTADLIEAMQQDAGLEVGHLKVDGGMVANQWLLQFIADIIAVDVHRPRITETTSVGIAILAGIGSGMVNAIRDLSIFCVYDLHITPNRHDIEKNIKKNGWKKALESTCYYST